MDQKKINSCSQAVTCRIKKRESGSTIIVENRSRLSVRFVRVDDCLFSSETIKCDFMYEVYKRKENKVEKIIGVTYVELKGGDFDHGVAQLEKTITLLKPRHCSVSKKTAYLIGNNIPSMRSATQKIKTRFKVKYNTNFSPKKIMYTDIIQDSDYI